MILRGRAVWHPWRNGPRGVIASAPARPPVRGCPPSAARSARRRRGSDGRRAVRLRRTLTIETSTRRPRYAVPLAVSRRSRSGRSGWFGGPKRPLQDGAEGIAETLSRFSTDADRHRWPDELTGDRQSFTPCTFPGRTTLASRESRSARDGPIASLIRVSARRSCVGTPPSRYDVRNVKPSSARATSSRTGRRGLLRRLARRTRPNDDAVTRVIDRKCAAFQELRHANQWIRRHAPPKFVAETFHRPCNRPATTRPPTCKNAKIE